MSKFSPVRVSRDWPTVTAVALHKARADMPLFLRRLFMKDLHHMFLYYEVQKGPVGTPAQFKQVVPDALSAEDWFRFHGRYSNGEKIVGGA